MGVFQQKRVWFWIAFAAIVIALAVLIAVPNIDGNSPNQFRWLALLPVFFIGLIASLDIFPLFALLTLGHASEAPTLAPCFQRPPPFGITLS
jgi:hypothetical protein